MASTPKRLKRAALVSLVALGALGASISAASAHYLTRACDRDGDDCVTLRCEDGGDDCRPVGDRYDRSDDEGGQPDAGYSPDADTPSDSGAQTHYYPPTYDGGDGVWDQGEGPWPRHSFYDRGDDDDDEDDGGSDY